MSARFVRHMRHSLFKSTPGSVLPMHLDDKIYVAGHRGLVGSALFRALKRSGFTNIIGRTSVELDLTDASAVANFFEAERPGYVFIAAARVGGIHANSVYPVDFLRDNILIQSNLIDNAWKTGVDRLLFLGSSCVYPKLAPQPIKEEYLLTGPLEGTNRPYALAKIAGIEACWSYNRQHGTRYLSAMPTNMYGPGDNYHPENSHVIPGLLRRFHEAKLFGAPEVKIWGSGTPRREFLYSDDLADACLFLMTLDDARFSTLLGSRDPDDFVPPLVNIGYGSDVTIRDLAEMIAEVVGYKGRLAFDTSKPDGTPRKLMDSSKIAGLGWAPKVTLETGLRQAYEDFETSQYMMPSDDYSIDKAFPKA